VNAPAGQDAPSVVADNVVVTFAGGVTALDGVSLRVAAGERVALVGPSGAGKSTLLDCLAGQVAPTTGRVHVPGRAARIYQDYRLVDRATALTNVLHGAAGRGLGWLSRMQRAGELRQAATRLLDRVGLKHRARVRVDRLSGGERQRVAIARALMSEPHVLLADEPVAALDAGSAEAVLALLSSLCREHRVTLVCVMHDPRLAAAHADRVVALAGGQQVTSDVAADTAGSGVAQASAPSASRGLPRWMQRGLASAAIFIALGWAAWITNLGGINLSQALGNTARFTGHLVPTAAELGRIDWLHLGTSFGQTLAMTLLGTTAALTWSLPLSALAARNIGPALVRWPVRMLLNVIRSVPSIVWALLCVGALGLGPLPGIVALAAYSTGYLTKFFYEAFESVDDRAPAALRAMGMSGVESFVAAVWPASRLAIASSCVFMLEYNFRAASVLGIVGAGGIGYDLKLAVEWANWHVVGVVLAILAVSVFAFDAAADWARRALR
jgi:phosphonate ABC transporter permease subunit PhnE